LKIGDVDRLVMRCKRRSLRDESISSAFDFAGHNKTVIHFV